MAEIIWTDPALNQLNDIAEYIAIDKISAAQKLVAEVFAKVERLQEFPESGKKPIELQEFDYREVVVPPCRIFYKIDNQTIYILYILRQERELRRYMLQQNP